MSPGGLGQREADALPSPIPWLARPGAVQPLDAPQRAAAPPSSQVGGARTALPAAAGPRAGCGSGSCGCQGETPPQVQPPAAAAPTRTEPAAPVAAKAAKPAKPPPKKAKRPGSGIPARPIIVRLVWARRIAQAFFLALCLDLLMQTAFRGTFTASADQPVRLPLPVEGFLLFDPFVAAMTLLSTHTIYRGLAWALVILALTLVFGRVFCGWICPFGTLHHFFGWVFPSRLHGRWRRGA